MKNITTSNLPLNIKVGLLCLLVLFLFGCDQEGPPTTEPEVSKIWIPNVNIVGTGSSRVGSFEFIQGEGVCHIGGNELPAVIYNAISWPEYSLRIFQAIVPANDNLHLLFFYSRADTISSVWHESYTDLLGQEDARGTVEEISWGIEAQPELFPLDLPPEEVVDGFIVEGDEISISGGEGSISIGQSSYSLYPFQVVDCLDCESGSNSGWYELHVVLGSGAEMVGFGILYFHSGNEGEVRLEHLVYLDPVLQGEGYSYVASWSYLGHHEVRQNRIDGLW